MGIDSNYDFSGWATRANMKCSDGRTIMENAFADQDGQTVPLVWNHQHNEANNVLGHALLKNRDEGVYAYCTFNDSEPGRMGKELVKHGDVNQLSIYANKLKQQGGNVIHGAIREVSLVLAGANPGAYIDSIMCHGEDSDEEGIIYTGEDIVLAHSEDENSEEEETLAHASDSKKDDETDEGDKKEDKKSMADNKEEKKTEETGKEKTVKDVFDTLTEEQKTVVYALIGQALEDAGVSDDEDEKEDVKHSEGGNDYMYNNVFDRSGDVQPANVLSHADQEEILSMAKKPGMTLKSAIEAYADDHRDALAHGFEAGTEGIGRLFPDFKDVHPGAPELIERDHDWVSQVLTKAQKSPVPRVRTKQIDARAADIRAKGYNKRQDKKTVSGNLKVLMRTTEPQTIYYRDALHRDDVIDITDFDVVAYQRNVMKRSLEEEVALAAMVGDGRPVEHADKIGEDHIRPIWTDDDLYTIKATVDVAGMSRKLQGSNTSANFGEEYIYTESIIAASLHAREKYKGKGVPDFYCTPHLLNVMLLARDLNGRRIYDSVSDLAKVLQVNNIFTVEQFEGLSREDENKNKFNLLGLFVNMANYQFGSAKGGEITSFEDFDIDFNQFKYLMETRLSGALTEIYSAIALEEPMGKAVTPQDPIEDGEG